MTNIASHFVFLEISSFKLHDLGSDVVNDKGLVSAHRDLLFQHQQQTIELSKTRVELTDLKEKLKKMKKRKKKEKQMGVRKKWKELGVKQAKRVLKPAVEDLRNIAAERDTRYTHIRKFINDHLN